MPHNEVMTQPVQNCARCNSNHDMIVFRRFLQAVIADNHIYEWWGECPNTHEPILCQVIYGDSELKGVYAPPQEG